MDDNTILVGFREYVRNALPRKEKVIRGSEGVIGRYMWAIERVCEQEKCTWDELSKNINAILPLYDTGGTKQSYGELYDFTILHALKAFRNFLAKGNTRVPIKKHNWTFEENFICCVLYIQTYIIKKKNTSVSELIKTAIPLLPGFSDKDPTNTLRQKFQNIKAIAASKNLTDTFPSDERPNASTDNKIAFEKAYDILI